MILLPAFYEELNLPHLPPGWDGLSILKTPENIDLLMTLGKDKLKFHSIDPLGAPSPFVDIDTLLIRGNSCKDKLNASNTAAERFQDDIIRLSFLYNNDISGKVVLWKEDVVLLNCTTIVNTSNKSLTDKNPLSESIFMLQGLIWRKRKSCQRGEIILTKEFNLPGMSIIHAVGSKYEYCTAAECSLYSSYRNILQLAKD